MTEKPLSGLTCVVRFESGRNGRKLIRKGRKSRSSKAQSSIRITRAMALAIRFEHLLKKGLVQDYSDFANLTTVDRSLISRLMNLRLLAPKIQEHLLSLKNQPDRAEPIFQKDLMPIARITDWNAQIIAYSKLCRRRHPQPPFSHFK